MATETEESRVGETKRDVGNTNRHATGMDVVKGRIWRFVIQNIVSGCRREGNVPIAGDNLLALFEYEPRIRDMIDVSVMDRLNKRVDGALRNAVVGDRSHKPEIHGPGRRLQLPDAFALAVVCFFKRSTAITLLNTESAVFTSPTCIEIWNGSCTKGCIGTRRLSMREYFSHLNKRTMRTTRWLAI